MNIRDRLNAVTAQLYVNELRNSGVDAEIFREWKTVCSEASSEISRLENVVRELALENLALLGQEIEK